MKTLNKLIAGTCLVAMLSGCGHKEAPLVTSPGIPYMKRATAFLDSENEEKGVVIKTEDKSNKRLIFFYDNGFNGTLDKVEIDNGISKYFCTNEAEIKTWQKDYESAREIAKQTSHF